MVFRRTVYDDDDVGNRLGGEGVNGDNESIEGSRYARTRWYLTLESFPIDVLRSSSNFKSDSQQDVEKNNNVV